jgi:peptidylprolyl isomerase
MKLVDIGDKVLLSFEGKLENGEIFYKTNEKHSNITVGENQIFPALEQELVGMQVGETKTVTLDARDAFGDHNEELLMSISKERIRPDISTDVGNAIIVDLAQGKKLKGVIVDVTDDMITVDFNHPYAGKKVVVTCTVISIENKDS